MCKHAFAGRNTLFFFLHGGLMCMTQKIFWKTMLRKFNILANACASMHLLVEIHCSFFYMGVSCAWRKKFSEKLCYASLIYLRTHVQACICWSKYTIYACIVVHFSWSKSYIINHCPFSGFLSFSVCNFIFWYLISFSFLINIFLYYCYLLVQEAHETVFLPINPH